MYFQCESKVGLLTLLSLSVIFVNLPLFCNWTVLQWVLCTFGLLAGVELSPHCKLQCISDIIVGMFYSLRSLATQQSFLQVLLAMSR